MKAAPKMSHRILLIDDEESVREFLGLMLEEEGYQIDLAENGEQGIAKLTETEFDLILTDLKMSGVSGMDVLRATKSHCPSTQVIVMTAFGTAETAVEAMKKGAADYITKPFKLNEFKIQLKKALHVRELQRENLYLRQRLEEKGGAGQLVGQSAPMRQLYDLILRLARTRATILITGESGTGKELVARAIHLEGPNSGSPFVAVDCGAIPKTLIESELFGYDRGAFTGATADRKGLFEAALDGTLFLDEIGELPLDMQVTLLRVLQERKVKRIGTTKERSLRCRVVAATNRDLAQDVATGAFREDLYYRLNVVQLAVPPLNERPEDIPLLVEHFVRKHGHDFRSDTEPLVQGATAQAMRHLMDYRFQGNVRELENIVMRAMALATGDMIDVDALPPQTQDDTLMVEGEASLPEDGVHLDAVLERIEKTLLSKALVRSGGVRKEAARLLGISFRSIRYRLAKHGIDGD